MKRKMIVRYLLAKIVFITKYFSRIKIYEFLRKELECHQKSNVLCIGSGGDVEKIVRLSNPLGLTTIDIDEKRNPDFVMDACDLKFESDKFETVVIVEVLEHIPYPERAVSEIRRVLKPGGKVVFTTPFCLGLHDTPHDYYRYTYYGLYFLFREFDKAKIEPRNGFFSTIAVLFLRAFVQDDKNKKIIGYIVSILAIPLAIIAVVIDNIIPLDGLCTGYTGVCYKKS